MSPISILLVEDNPLAQIVMKNLLLSKEYSVDVAGTGSEALEKFKQHLYQIVFMDINLPDFTGFEVTLRIRDYEVDHHQTPAWIIGFTANVGQEERDESVQVGMNEIYPKPLSAELIDDILQMVISTIRMKSKIEKPVPDHIDQIPVIDLNLGAEILGGSLASAEQMISELVNMLPGDLKKIKDAFSKKDYSTLRDLAHYVKGGASFCGTPRLKEAAGQLDQVIRVESDDEEIEAAYKQLCQEITAVMDEMKR